MTLNGIAAFGTALMVCAAAAALRTGGVAQTPEENLPPYKNAKLPVEARVEDLLKRMTLEEKLNQIRCDMRDEVWVPALKTTGFGEAAVILRGLTSREAAARADEVNKMALDSRLEIPLLIHDEALHGLVGNGATSFPQAIGLAATWDTPLIARVADAIAKECKARGVRHVLSPVINVVRDARWGRVEETYGEDPLLTARMGVAFVKAFESNGVATTPKHYVANVGDGGRDSHSIQISERALRDIYLLPFEAVVKEGAARSIMSAYNAVNGRACTASRWLLTDILRDEYGFRGFVVSDYGSVGGILYSHHNTANEKDTAAAAINAGLDMEYPGVHIWGDGLEQAIKEGLVSDKTLDEAVRRVLRVKFELGLFDEPPVSPDEAERIVQSPEHRSLAIEAARSAMVLLKNRNGTLPLKKDLKSIAVIGPTATGGMPLGGYSGFNMPTVSVLDGIKAKVGPGVNVEWVKGSEFQSPQAMPAIPAECFSELKGEYFANRDLSGSPALVRSDAHIAFDWSNAAPDPSVPRVNFSVRWSGKLIPPETGDYTLTITSDDGVRLYLDGDLVFQDWTEHAPSTGKVKLHLEKGKPVELRLEYFQAGGGAVVQLGWGLAGLPDAGIEESVRLAKRSDVAIIVAGIREGEGADRASLDLPGNQEELINAVAATGTPTVVILIAGAPVTMQKWVDSADAIVDAWYPGQEGGTAIADVLFGDVNPGGKLPMTFPMSVGQCPIYYNVEPSGRGYDYVDLTGQPLFPFGYGLSYTTFEYSNLRITPEKADQEQPITITFDVQNTGSVKGDEVPQLYLRDVVASVVRPLKELKDFTRITLEPGEKKTVTFRITRDQLAFYDEKMKRVVEPGEFAVMIGSSSSDIRLRGSFSFYVD